MSSANPLRETSALRTRLERDRLFTLADRCIRIPLIVRGKLVVPDAVNTATIESAFAAADEKRSVSAGRATRVQIGAVQVLRSADPHRETVYTVLPDFEPMDVVESDPGALAAELYDLPFEEVLGYVAGLHAALRDHADILEHIREATVGLSDVPRAWHDAAFAEISDMLDVETMRAAVDHDLSRWGVPGTRFLDDWVDVDSRPLTAPVHRFAEADRPTRTPQLRALGTRQLHITAGNSPQIPLVSALRALLTKSAAVIKSPAGATVPAALFGAVAATTAPDHPITKHLSFVYWPGGHARYEDVLFAPGLFDRIVVWGAPDAVMDVKAKAALTKVVAFNPRYSVSMIGREAFATDAIEDLDRVASRAVTDSLVANQKACIASQVHYIETTDPALARTYAQSVQRALARMDGVAPNAYPRAIIGQIKRLQRGRLLDADWYVNENDDGHLASGAVVVPGEFPMTLHPMCRLIVIRPVDDLRQTLGYLHPAVATVGVHPEPRRLELRNVIAARGVSNIVPLGEAGVAWPDMSHDGMMVLGELVDWKNA